MAVIFAAENILLETLIGKVIPYEGSFWASDGLNYYIYCMWIALQTLNYIPDQDTFYDMTDAFERQDIEGVSQRMCNKSNSDLDLVEQFKLYEVIME